MSHHHEQHVPRPVLIAAGLLMVFAIGLAATARSAQLEDPTPRAAVLESVELRFTDRDDGGISVFGEGGAEVYRVQPESNGFIRGVLRGMYRTRRIEGRGPDEPFVLERLRDGKLQIRDPQTGHEVELRSFGHTNYEAFVAVLEAAR